MYIRKHIGFLSDDPSTDTPAPDDDPFADLAVETGGLEPDTNPYPTTNPDGTAMTPGLPPGPAPVSPGATPAANNAIMGWITSAASAAGKRSAAAPPPPPPKKTDYTMWLVGGALAAAGYGFYTYFNKKK
jgi:hypothetical protein